MAQDLPLPPAQAYQPATFQERGVAVPFTSPLLAGARVRRGERHRVEWVVPNPSGGRGVYILPWSSVRTLFRPSVHDSRLNKRIAALEAISPAAVRGASLEIASQGLAGPQAMAAARAATAGDEEDRLLTQFMLLVLLAEQAEPSGLGPAASRDHRSLELERRARQIVARVAPRFDRTPEEILAALAALTDAFAANGVAMQTTPARVPRLLARLTDVQAELGEWAQSHAEDINVGLADMIAGFGDFTVRVTELAMARARSLTQDMAGLLQTWSKTPERVYQLVARTEWLLDGWEQVCLLWQASRGPEQRRAVLTEMAQLVPVIPREVADWGGELVNPDDAVAGHGIHLNKDWRTGAAVLNLTARNERLRAFLA